MIIAEIIAAAVAFVLAAGLVYGAVRLVGLLIALVLFRLCSRGVT